MDLIINDPFFLDSEPYDDDIDIPDDSGFLYKSKPLQDDGLSESLIGHEMNDEPESHFQSQLDPNIAHALYKLRAVSSWDEFLGPHSLQYNKDRGPKLQTRFVSDRPRDAYEAILANDKAHETVIDVKLFIKCLKFLFLGRESELFRLDKRYLKFEFQDQYQHDFRVYAFSSSTIENICSFAINMGSLVNRLRYTCNRVWKIISKGPDSSSQAMLTAFSEMLDGLIRKIETEAAAQINEDTGLVELLNIFDEPFKIVNILCTVLGCDDIDNPVRLDEIPDPYKLMDELYIRAAVYQGSDDTLFELVTGFLDRVSRPWFSTLSELTGLIGDGSLFWRPVADICEKMAFLQFDEEQQMIFMNEQSKPIFMDDQTILKIIETLNCMIMFCKYGNGNLSNLREKVAGAPRMHWIFTEKKLTEFEDQLQQYEQKLPIISEKFPNDHDDFDIYSRPEEIDVLDIYSRPEDIEKLIEDMNNKLFINNREKTVNAPGSPTELTISSNTDVIRNPPVTAVPQLSFCKLLDVQWKRANELAMTIFHGNVQTDIRMYADLIKSVFLFGSGTFVRDLEDALYGTTFGCLNLDNRQTWPPLEREINQGLSDVVEQCITDKGYKASDFHLNFGLLQGSDDIKVHEFDATDVLDLIFVIPLPFSLIISGRLVNLYKSIFSHLLQLQRLLHLLKHDRTPSTRSFSHFIYCIYQHVIAVIEMNWKNLEKCHFTPGMTLERMMTVYQTTARSIYRQINISKPLGRQMTMIMNNGFQMLQKSNFDQTEIDKEICEFYSNVTKHGDTATSLLVNLDYNGYYSRMI